MKKILAKLAIAAFLLIPLVACDDDGGDTDTRLTAVKTLYEPIDGKEIELSPLAGASTYFEWEYCSPAETGIAVYSIAFDKTGGDFSAPVYTLPADNNGQYNYSTITHKQLNKIAGMMGIGPSEEGTFKWTVFSSKGLKTAKSDKEHNIIVTRLAGFADLPVDVYVTGEASEGGNDISQAYIMKAIAPGEFEVYTRLAAGKPFYFTNGTTGEPRVFYTENGLIKENGISTVATDGVYKITLDFNTGACTYKHIVKVSLFLNWSQVKIELPYKAYGVWELTNHTITGLTGSDNTDDRYKFRMESAEGETEWRAPNNDSKPTGNEAYYYMEEKDNVTQWTDGQIWKTPATDGWSGKTYDFTFSLNSAGSYTHNLVIK